MEVIVDRMLCRYAINVIYIKIKKYPKFMNISSRVSKKDAKQEKIITKQ
jgi:hypothetical protein